MSEEHPRHLTSEEVIDLRREARHQSEWARQDLKQSEASLQMPPDDLAALTAHRRDMEADIEAGRFHPGERRCVTLPSGSRFHLEHPEPGGDPTNPRPWWRRLLHR